MEIGDRTEVISVDRLKPHLGTGPVKVAQPPLRGRPPKVASVLNSVPASDLPALSLGGAPVEDRDSTLM